MGSEGQDSAQCPGCGRAFQFGQATCIWCGETLPELEAPPAQEYTCPCCDGERLAEQRGDAWVVYTCETCGGLWMTAPILKRFEEFYEQAVKNAGAPEGRPARPKPAEGVRDAAPIERLYRGCPRCGEQMARRRYKRVSDVVVDECLGHGVWFDADEFQQVIAFLQAGGLEASRQYDAHTRAARDQVSRELSDLRRTMRHSGFYAARFRGGGFF